MMNKLILALFAVTLSACGPQFKGEGLKISPEFQPYVNSFVAQSHKQNRAVKLDNLTIEIDNSMPGPQGGGSWILAICWRGGLQNKITVNPHFWNASYSHAEREELIFHELGHCVLNREHVETFARTLDSSYSRAVSIMYPYHLGQNRYIANYDYYMQELFGVASEPVLYAYGIHGTFDNTFYASLASLFEEETHTYKAVANVGTNGFTIEGMGCGQDEEEASH